ncbi:tyrosine-type recombinase/integrase [Helicobacter pylori]|uniref:tyrosine-type recombinase/integrase n=1 Tax=Helicobacter pylori TaxID=210 RepID=UPI0013F4964B|nr:tyrosine-type recombinase/integrase [Helicobacter pylori]NHB43030.1 site-specific integrase [Helicobacter pylori]
MPHNKLTKSQRELFCNLKAFLYTKAKNFTPIQDVKDMALILDTQDKILKCHNIEQLKQLCHILYNQGIKHTIMMQGLFLFFNYFKDNLKLRSFRMLSEEQVINFLFELAQNRKPSSMAKYVMYLRQFFDYLDRKKHYNFDFALKNLAFAKTKESLPRHLNYKDLKSFLKTLLDYKPTTSFEKRNKCVLLIVILGGLRKCEVLNIELKHIQVEEQNYSILIQGKGRKERKAYIKKSLLEPSLNAWLSDDYRLKYFNGAYLFKKDKQKSQNSLTLYNFIPLIFKLAQIKHYKQYGTGLHLFRHSFATLIYQETQDLVLTSRALGHSSLLSTKIYVHTTQEHNKKVALVFDSLIENKK